MALISLCVASVAIGAEGGGAEGDHGLPWMNFLFRVINFILFLGIIWYFAGSKIKEFFSGRKSEIKSELDDLQARRTDAESRLRDVEQSIANISKEREEILDQYRSQGEALKQSIVEEAEKKAEQIKKQAEVTVQQETQMAIDSIRAEMADQIIEAAEKIIKDKLKKKDHEKLVDEYLEKVVLN
jgi:F-type H+-transporting ATPase subunit b